MFRDFDNGSQNLNLCLCEYNIKKGIVVSNIKIRKSGLADNLSKYGKGYARGNQKGQSFGMSIGDNDFSVNARASRNKKKSEINEVMVKKMLTDKISIEAYHKKKDRHKIFGGVPQNKTGIQITKAI